jgi:hypothetical protein
MVPMNALYGILQLYWHWSDPKTTPYAVRSPCMTLTAFRIATNFYHTMVPGTCSPVLVILLEVLPASYDLYHMVPDTYVHMMRLG